MGLWAETYYAARQFAAKLGYSDLAAVIADRYEWAAEQSGDPLATALTAVFRAGDLDSAGDWHGGQAVMADALDHLDDHLRSPAAFSVRGFLHLCSAYIAAHEPATSQPPGPHHAEAEELAGRLAVDRDDYRLYFGPTNVAIWGTALGVELMDGAEAVRRARSVTVTADTPRERAGHHYPRPRTRPTPLRRPARGADVSLLTARQVAPAQTRHHPLARETVFALGRAERRATDSLRGLAVWMGIQD